MTHRHSAAGSRELAARWCALAEQRLEHLSEMFETGRWRRYHSELAFLENIQEAKRAVQTWRALANGGDVAAAAASVTSAFGWSPATMPRVFPREQAQTLQLQTLQPKALQPKALQPKAVHIAPETAVPVRLEPELDVLAEIVEAPIAPAAPAAPVAPTAPAAPPAPVVRMAPAAPVASIASFLQTFSPPAAEIVAAPERVVEFTFSLDGIQAKYPLLRNTF
ncbi:putative repeat protein (TIGR03809 family) [Bradyrhizobium sp. S3.2.6]|uniref:TIGR03809 family protein n=1 Tax=Bradyrhizobium sp. S3.2.6 TaxID=3156428 RepID=UPI003398F6A7